MSPARVRHRRVSKFRSKYTKKNFNFKRIFLVFSLAVFLVLSFIVVALLLNKNKINMAVGGKTGAVYVSSFDFEAKKITTFVIPATVELEVSRSLGKWKAKSLWQLGINEKLGGTLLSETVTRNFHFPIFLWADNLALGFSEGGVAKALTALFAPYKTNLGIMDRIRLFFIAVTVKSFDREVTDLSKTSYLRKTKLADGEEGYVVTKNLPQELIYLFTETLINERETKVEIVDLTGTYGVSEGVGATVEVLGAKILATTKGPPNDSDCLVLGKDRLIVGKIAKVFSCKEGKGSDNDRFDIQIKIGKKFAQRF